MLDRTIAPPIHDAITFDIKLPKCNEVIGKNNIPLYWLKAGTQEVIEISWVFEAGIWQESQTAVAQATAALMKNGTRTKTALQINEALEYYGGSLKISANNDYGMIVLHSMTKHLHKLLPIINEILTEATYPEEELKIYKQNALQRLSLNLQRCEFVANRHIDACLFGMEYPYGKFTQSADIVALETNVLRSFHHQYYSSNNCKMFVAGNFTDKDLSYIAATFTNEEWNSTTKVQIPTYSVIPAIEKKHFISNDPKGVQGAIRIAAPTIRRNHEDFIDLIVLNTIFGGYFGSRLMSNIREEKGYTYGIYSNLFDYKQNGALMVATEAGTDVCKATIEEVYKEMDILQQELVDDEELLLVKNYMMGTILSDIDGPFSIMQRWKSLILKGNDIHYFEKSVAAYKNITAERIQTLAQRYLNKEDYYELLVI